MPIDYVYHFGSLVLPRVSHRRPKEVTSRHCASRAIPTEGRSPRCLLLYPDHGHRPVSATSGDIVANPCQPTSGMRVISYILVLAENGFRQPNILGPYERIEFEEQNEYPLSSFICLTHLTVRDEGLRRWLSRV